MDRHHFSLLSNSHVHVVGLNPRLCSKSISNLSRSSTKRPSLRFSIDFAIEKGLVSAAAAASRKKESPEEDRRIEKLSNFRTLTKCSDDDLLSSILDKAKWSLAQAIDDFYDLKRASTT